MTRAGVFIGVNKTGKLQLLRDAAAGAERMHEWAIKQGMVDKISAKLITDASKKVTPDDIFSAIQEIIDGPGVDQLIVYFAGHGVNINRGEYWLLSDAPANANAAVNVAGSIELARYCGIKHVVFISDACRVAPEGLQAQGVRGSDIFPNETVADKARAVDQFFACVLGRTAAELKDPIAAAGNYKALYTETLLNALWGRQLDVLEQSIENGDLARYVKPRKLQAHLEMAIPQRVKQLGLTFKVNQEPDAIITSDGLWLSRVNVDALERAVVEPEEPSGPVVLPEVVPQNLHQVTDELVRTAVRGAPSIPPLLKALESTSMPVVPHSELLAASVSQVEAPFGPDHFETNCGIKVRGIRISSVSARTGHVELLGQELVRVDLRDAKAANVLVRFEGGVGTIIPVMSGFLAAVTFEDGELINIAYEPSTYSPRWSDYDSNMPRLRRLRAVAASASQYGRFRLEREDANDLAQQMQVANGIDPTLSIYAAYAYYDLQEIERIRTMSQFLQGDLGITFFDIALLGRELIGKQVKQFDPILPSFPLLSQGWALLRANRVKMSPAMEGIDKTITSSLWTLFSPEGVERLGRAMDAGEIE